MDDNWERDRHGSVVRVRGGGLGGAVGGGASLCLALIALGLVGLTARLRRRRASLPRATMHDDD